MDGVPRPEKHIFVGDFHCPDENKQVVSLFLKFVQDFKPDYVHIMGDFVNFTTVSRYPIDPHLKMTFSEELDACRSLFTNIVYSIRKANKDSIIEWIEGNHESRLIKYLTRNAQALATVEIEKEEILSIPHLFALKYFDVTWIPDTQVHTISGGVLIEHGDVARKYGGYTARAMQEKRNVSGFSGHTHRLALHMRTTNETNWWIETGCMCNLQPEPAYVKSPDWQNGFTVGVYDGKTFYPTIIPILHNSFIYGGRVYA